MSHLNAETLARLVDEQPDALEAAHLAACEDCRSQLDAIRADVQALGELGAIEPPAHAWGELHERLVAEGLVRAAPRGLPAWMQLAAALALFLTGTAAGFVWRGATLPAPPAVAGVDAGDPAQPHTAMGELDAEPDAAPQRASDDAAVPAAGDVRSAATSENDDSSVAQQPGDARLASASDDARGDTRALDAPRDDRPPQSAREDSDRVMPEGEPRITGRAPADPRFALGSYSPRNAQEAATMLRDAESMYLDALAQYAQLSGELREIDDPVARLVVLESIVLTTREALARAPADPIINGYHMTAVAQRDATLRQLAARSGEPWY